MNWTFDKREGDEWWFGGRDGKEIVISDSDGEFICVLGANAADTTADDHAKLIAAAPNMLAALRETLEFVEGYEDVVDGSDGPQANDAMRLAQTIRAIILKATGAA